MNSDSILIEHIVQDHCNLYFPTVIMCPSLLSIVNGEIVYSTDATAPHVYGTTANYVCNSGFGLSIRGSRTCTGEGSSTTGSWVGFQPTCERVFCYHHINNYDWSDI